jgi:hypothetical protein
MRQNASIDYDNMDDMAFVSTIDAPTSDVYVDFQFIFIKTVLICKSLKFVLYILLPVA